jgi:single-stranded-DNA-specific exonuclease
MSKQYLWNIQHKEKIASVDEVIDVLLQNRSIISKQEKEEFFTPKHPNDFSLEELSIDRKEMEKALSRIEKAIENKEHVLVYGDYDADGVCSTSIMWQTLYHYTKNVTPFMPDRFIDGYGLNPESIEKLKSKNEKLSLIVTVDNGIVANEAVDKANELGIDVIITDHHQKGKSLPKAHAIVHTDMICGAGVAWIVARELHKSLTTNYQILTTDSLDLAAIGTIADQMPLVGVNRSFAYHGLKVLSGTKRLGLLALLESCAIEPGKLGTYEVNYIIAPRINAMGRLENAMDSLRLLCTTNKTKARELANTLGRINGERQKMVEQMVLHAKSEAKKKDWLGVIVLAHETYHEGVIGLIASRLVDEYYRPAIILAKSETTAKASARSIHGFNIIENIRKLDHLLIAGGGHPMAAGFSIKNSDLEEFEKQMELLSKELLTDDMLKRKLNIDTELSFNAITDELLDKLLAFNPVGLGNMTPLFATKNVHVDDANLIGSEKKHLKMHLSEGNHHFEAIAFNMSEFFDALSPDKTIDIAYSIDKNVWNGRVTTQLKIKDLKVN